MTILTNKHKVFKDHNSHVTEYDYYMDQCIIQSNIRHNNSFSLTHRWDNIVRIANQLTNPILGDKEKNGPLA